VGRVAKFPRNWLTDVGKIVSEKNKVETSVNEKEPSLPRERATLIRMDAIIAYPIAGSKENTMCKWTVKLPAF